MKKAALVAAALAMVLSLAACGNRDNNASNDPSNGNGTTENGGPGVNGGTTAGNGGMNDNGTGVGNGTVTDPGTGTGTNTGLGNGTGTGSSIGSGNSAGTNTGSDTDTGIGTGTGTDPSVGRSRVGNDLRRAADDVGDAVTGLVDEGRSAVARGTNTTTFQRMLDNARVHDVDGVLTDGENSRW